MTTTLEAAEDLALDHGIDPNSSPLGSVGASFTSTPNTDMSPPESPVPKQRVLTDAKMWAKSKVAQLTEKEKVGRWPWYSIATSEALLISDQISLLTAADFWRTTSIASKGVPAAKTSDGPNGARGEVFVGGTKVSSKPSRKSSEEIDT